MLCRIYLPDVGSVREESFSPLMLRIDTDVYECFFWRLSQREILEFPFHSFSLKIGL